jgi:RNA polymerase sigma-70 factor (ECF subfamily)
LLDNPADKDYLVCGRARAIASQESLYQEAAETYGSALDRLARAYELDADARRDLLQEIHLHLWRSFAQFDGRCSLRTWVYRVAHNVATGHVIRQRRLRNRWVTIESLEAVAGEDRVDLAAGRNEALERLSALIQRLKPLDRQIIVLYLESMDASCIGEVTGLSAANIAMKIHRIKNLLRRWFDEGALHVE